jgi:hypothetical protein
MKEFALEDPMELVGVELPEGDLDQMARCLIEEYLLLGWNERQLMSLFTRPCFRTTHRIYQEKGAPQVEALIQQVVDEWRQGSVHTSAHPQTQGGCSDA